VWILPRRKSQIARAPRLLSSVTDSASVLPFFIVGTTHLPYIKGKETTRCFANIFLWKERHVTIDSRLLKCQRDAEGCIITTIRSPEGRTFVETIRGLPGIEWASNVACLAGSLCNDDRRYIMTLPQVEVMVDRLEDPQKKFEICLQTDSSGNFALVEPRRKKDPVRVLRVRKVRDRWHVRLLRFSDDESKMGWGPNCRILIPRLCV
jgi:hypothetical protein